MTTFLVELVILLIILWLIMKYIWPALNKMMIARQEEIRVALASAEAARQDAENADGEREAALIAELTTRIRAYEANMEAMEVRKAAGELRAIWVAGNEYLQSAAPWTVVKTDPEAAALQRTLDAQR